MVVNGHSLQSIQTKLYNLGIKSPSGKDKWTRDVIDKTINNSEYLSYDFSCKLFNYPKSATKNGISIIQIIH